MGEWEYDVTHGLRIRVENGVARYNAAPGFTTDTEVIEEVEAALSIMEQRSARLREWIRLRATPPPGETGGA